MSAMIVANNKDRITLTFTPQEGGLAFLQLAWLNGSASPTTVGSNTTSFSLPSGDSKLFLIFFPGGPAPEQGSLTFTANDGAANALDSDYIANFPNPITLFGQGG